MIVDLRILENQNGTQRLQMYVVEIAGVDEDGVMHLEQPPRGGEWRDVPVYSRAAWTYRIEEGEVLITGAPR